MARLGSRPPERADALGLPGQGVLREAAQASAIMEAVEISVAERVQPTLDRQPVDMQARHEAFDLLPGFIRRGQALPDPRQAIGWVRGHDLMTDHDVWVPAQAVQIDPTDPDRPTGNRATALGRAIS